MVVADSHAHLLERYYPGEVEATLARARAAGVAIILNVGTTVAESAEAAALAERNDDVWATAGVHPHEARDLDAAALERLRELLARPRVVAVGECGLDYHYDLSPREVQREALRTQIRLAREVKKPLVLHNRESDQDLLAILREEGAAEAGGVLHCFTAGPEAARQALDLGFHLGFGGILTFKNADEVRAALKLCPLDRVLLETDCPYLTPIPHRGKRNEPAYVALVLAKVAEITGLTPEHLAEATSANTRRLLRIA